ncbi:hypothetical protein K501DRAFT_40719 [Backusella circina FSU 941]|nr:hypothetical protein K501DRAFT_40719 [Backusella circina FSU 941]
MIMDVHPSFLISKPGQIIQEVMVSKETEVSPLDDACCQTISWRRKCTAEWDMDSQSFQPLSQTKLVDEPVVLLFFEANRFIQHIVEDTLDGTIRKLKRSCRDKQVMMMMEGLETYYKKRKLLESRQFQQAVRQSINDDNDTRSASSKRKKKTSIYETGPKKEEVEKVLVQLQMVEDIMLIPTKSAADSASWLESLTTDLALGRYK